jgi:hypothetical protein
MLSIGGRRHQQILHLSSISAILVTFFEAVFGSECWNRTNLRSAYEADEFARTLTRNCLLEISA